jgi:hypothetical protein
MNEVARDQANLNTPVTVIFHFMPSPVDNLVCCPGPNKTIQFPPKLFFTLWIGIPSKAGSQIDIYSIEPA